MLTLKLYRTISYEVEGLTDKENEEIAKTKKCNEFLFISCHHFSCLDRDLEGTYTITVWKEKYMLQMGDGVEYQINDDLVIGYSGCYVLNDQGKTIDHFMTRARAPSKKPIGPGDE